MTKTGNAAAVGSRSGQRNTGGKSGARGDFWPRACKGARVNDRCAAEWQGISENCDTREGRAAHAPWNPARNVAAFDAFDAAVKIAFLSAFRTESHAARYCA